MKAQSRLVLALAAILSATALDAQQSEGRYPTESGELIVRSSQPTYDPPPKPGSIDELDTNGDGLISRAEASSNHALINEFDHADLNRDDNISAAELSKWH
jgi:hypothetical protein